MDEFDDTPRKNKRKQKPIIEGSTIVLVIACIFGLIIVGVGLNLLSNQTIAEANATPIPTPTPKSVITASASPVPTVTPSLTVQPTTNTSIFANKSAYITPLPTTQPVVTITAPIVVAEKLALLNYTFESKQYRMIISLPNDITNSYKTRSAQSVCTRYGNNITACTQEENASYYLSYVHDPYQNGVLNDIVSTIQTQTNNPDDQARIAISLVQQIPYDEQKAKNMNSAMMRYPYMVVYDNKGICSEKSMLLAALLERMGYGVVLFHFDSEKHMTTGVKAPADYSYAGTGYAFIETTYPSIPTDSDGNYGGIGKLTSTPFVYVVTGGKPMGSIGFENNDLIEYRRITSNTNTTLPMPDYNRWKEINVKYGLVVK